MGRGDVSADALSACVFDPLDGSSNIDAGVNVGTIFGIYKVVRSAPLLLDLIFI
jgi:fructose-1,6-bisphosphatase